MPAQFFSAVVAAPGTPQQLVKATVPAQASVSGVVAGTVSPRGSCIIFQAGPLNTSAKSIYIGGPSLSVSGKTGIGIVLTPGAFSPPIHVEGDADAGDFWIDTDSTVANNERVFVTVI